MTLSIINWDSEYEKSDTRKCKEMKWIAVPTKMDGLRFKKIAAHKDRFKIFSCWILLLQVASKMPERGILKSELGDLTFEDMELMTGFPADGFKLVIAFLIQIQWIADSSGDHPDSIPTNREIIPTTVQDITVHNKTIQDNTLTDNFSGEFDVIRKMYPGTKRGLEIEYNDFKKKNPINKFLLAVMKVGLERQIAWRESAPEGQFIPQWKYFKTWLNQCCWTEELETFDSRTSNARVGFKTAAEKQEDEFSNLIAKHQLNQRGLNELPGPR